MKLTSRLERLEGLVQEEGFITFLVRTGENAEAKQKDAWQRYHDGGGWQDFHSANYVRINKVFKV